MRNSLFRLWIGAAALAGLVAVAAAALSAHAGLDTAALALLRTASEMAMWHALALFGVGLWARSGGGLAVQFAGGLFLSGILLFCGAVFLLALAGLRLGSVAPVGGTLLMAGWIALGVAAIRDR